MSEKSLTELATAIRRQVEQLSQDQPAGPASAAPIDAAEVPDAFVRAVAEAIASELSRTFDTSPDVNWQPVVQLTAELRNLVQILRQHEENLAGRMLVPLLEGVEEDLGPRLDRIEARLRALAMQPLPERRPRRLAAVALALVCFLAGVATAPFTLPYVERAAALARGVLASAIPSQ
jgi:hypothetical protein